MAGFLGGLFKVIWQRELPALGLPDDVLAWPGKEPADTLVVFAHEWGGTGRSRWRMQRLLWDQPADTRQETPADTPGNAPPLGPVDLFAPRYLHNPLSNLPPAMAARFFQETIHAVVRHRALQGRPYRSVVLVGYSAGSLVLRKAMVWGLGQLEDHPEPELGREHLWQWALQGRGTGLGTSLSRVVLVAGINRGWSLEERPANMSSGRYSTYKLMAAVVRLCRRCGFILALERGEPFVADLRLQWLKVRRRLGWLPPTIQVLGTVDDIVGREDNKDVLALDNAKIFLVDGADHKQVMHVHEERQRSRLIAALTADEATLEDTLATAMDRAESERALRGESSSVAPGAEPAVAMIVLPVHGIRANADWCIRLRRLLLAQAVSGQVIYCPCRSYGHFSILRFLLFGRRRMVRWFVDLYTEAVATVGDPNVAVHVVGHSNGTYLVSRALLDYRTVSVDRLALTGSVVQRHFPWRRLHLDERIGQLRNERAAGDLVVGFFPGFYQQLGALLPGSLTFFDIGNGGLLGFDDPPPGQDVERFYLAGGHGAAVEPANLPHLVDFLLDRPEQQREFVERIPWWIALLSNLAWAVWLTIAVALVAIGWWLAVYIHSLALIPFVLVLLIVIATV